MERATIDFGIDLGTTNSSIAVIMGTETETFKNNDGFDYTPSAVWITGKGVIHTGLSAKNQWISNNQNTQIEFKRQMGTDQIYEFPASGCHLTPEALSAEVLKTLRGDVQQRTGEEITAAVIGVPAIFELPQNQATMKAAEMAGFSTCRLVQEPVAAALAYGFQNKKDKVFWLIYDLGGGTFDAAVISLREGQIQVVNHGGDNQLGGKDIDWAIVDQILIPRLKSEFVLSEFYRGNTRWQPLFWLLKSQVEIAKIRLSRNKSVPLIIESHNDLFKDDKGKTIRLEYDLQRNEIEPLLETVVNKSINICRKVLHDAKLDTDAIEKLVLVGGPTLSPFLRKMLGEQLQIPLEFNVDPLTIVARGAAVFASTQKLSSATSRKPLDVGHYRIELEYQPVGSEADPLVGGKIVTSGNEDLVGFTIEFVEEKTGWSSGKIPIGKNRAFMINLRADEKRTNVFLIHLRDKNGNTRKAEPAQLTYTIGNTISEQIIQISMGVALANGEMDIIVNKGETLPIRKRKVFHATTMVKSGNADTCLRVPVLQGENKIRADRNANIGQLVLLGNQVKRDVPIGSEVEVTIEIDESQQIHTYAYIPIIDEEIRELITQVKRQSSYGDLNSDFEKEKKRLQAINEKKPQAGFTQAEEYLHEISVDHITSEIATSLNAAKNDPDALQKCEKLLRELKAALDSLENELEWPALVAEAKESTGWAKEIVDKYGKEQDKNRFKLIESEIQQAIYANNEELLYLKVNALRDLARPLLMEQPGFWVGWLNHLEEKKGLMTDIDSAARIINQGRRAIEANDLHGLKTAVRQLIELLPQDEQENARNYGSTII